MKWILLVWLGMDYSPGVRDIPHTFRSEQACIESGRHFVEEYEPSWNSPRRFFHCLPVPMEGER